MNRLVTYASAALSALALAAIAGCSSSSRHSADGSSGSAGSGGSGGTVTVYSADGLHSDTGNDWDNEVFAEFTKATGIKVRYVEAGSGAIVQRLAREKSNPQADVLVTLPPFIQQADSEGLLQPYTPAGASAIPADQKDPNGVWYPLVNDYLAFIYDKSQVGANPPKTWQDLLASQYKNKLQYSTPGVAGDGTGVLIEAMHDFGSESAADAYLKQLQGNNVGPSSSTGALESKVNKGELLVANGDVQMNYEDALSTYPNLKIWFPQGPDGKPNTFALPYDVGLVKNAPNGSAGQKLIDFMLSKQSQSIVASAGGGLPVRDDVHPTDATYRALAALLSGVTIFTPDWSDIESNLRKYVTDWQNATGTV